MVLALCVCVFSQLRFVCGEPIEVELLLSNPLKVPLLLQHVSLSTEGARCDAPPLCITLPPSCLRQKLLLTLVPRETGNVKIRGTWIRACNLLWEQRVDQTGRGIRPSYDDVDNSPYCPALDLTTPPSPSSVDVFHLEILPSMPLLSFSFLLRGPLSHCFFLGERRRALLRLVNEGEHTVQQIELQARPQFKAGSAQSQERYYDDPREQEEMEQNRQAAARDSKKAGLGLMSPKGSQAAPGVQRKHSLPAAGASRSRSASSAAAGAAASAPAPAAVAAAAPSQPLIVFDPAKLQAQLPLAPGAVLNLEVDIAAHTEWSNVHSHTQRIFDGLWLAFFLMFASVFCGCLFCFLLPAVVLCSSFPTLSPLPLVFFAVFSITFPGPSSMG